MKVTTRPFLILLVKSMLCCKLHYQKTFRLKVVSYKIGAIRGRQNVWGFESFPEAWQ